MMTRTGRGGALLLAAITIVAGFWADDRASAVGDLDSTFGTAGVVTTDFNGDQDYIGGMALQADGKIVVAGSAYNPAASFDFGVARYNTNGTLDTSFGGTGKVTLDFAGQRDQAYAVAIQPDGKIIAAGTAVGGATGSDLALTRFNTNGTVDTGFGTGGKVYTPLTTSDDEIYAIVLQPDGKIVATGVASHFSANSNIAIVRYNSNGTLDTGFGGPAGGIIITDFFGGQDEGSAIAITGGGKIIVAGKCLAGPAIFDASMALIQLNSDGSMDNSFGTAGKRTDRTGTSDIAYALAIQPDGKFLVGGSSIPLNDPVTLQNFALFRHNADGSLDTSFGNGGVSLTNIYGQTPDAIRALALQADGKIVAAGWAGGDIAVARFTGNGGLDSKIRLDPFEFGDRADAVAIQPDGKIVVAGQISNSTAGAGVNFGVARLVSLTTFLPRFVPGDFDGDGKTDLAVYRPNAAYWYALNSSNGAFRFQQMGGPIHKPVPADYDGDGKMDFAVYADGGWFIRRSSNNTDFFTSLGNLTDKPLPRDYNGNGVSEVSVYRPSNGVWFSLPETGSNVRTQQWGLSTDLPVPGDYDRDGTVDFAVFRPSDGNWFILRSSNNTIVVVNWGVNSDRPVPGDYDGDQQTDVAVWRPSDGNWYLLRSSDGTFQLQQWGNGSFGDIPVPGDYDGDGKFDCAVFRSGVWYWLQSSNGAVVGVQFGQSGDIPAPAAYIP